MPYGLSVPHYFAVSFGVIGVVYGTTGDWQLAWATGIAWNIVQGVIMTIGAFVGIYIQRYIPRAAMLGALAGLAITYIALPPAGLVFATPYIGLTSLAIVFVGWFALKKMPFNIPAGAFAIMVGTLLAWATGYMEVQAVSSSLSNVGLSFPGFTLNMIAAGFQQIAPFLPAAIPLAIYDFMESLDN
jgi:AGZA family xanthine/uracil permease-like MFS transporter